MPLRKRRDVRFIKIVLVRWIQTPAELWRPSWENSGIQQSCGTWRDVRRRYLARLHPVNVKDFAHQSTRARRALSPGSTAKRFFRRRDGELAVLIVEFAAAVIRFRVGHRLLASGTHMNRVRRARQRLRGGVNGFIEHR